LEKIDVNGSNAHPVYQHLREHAPELEGGNVPHNFGKFVIMNDAKQSIKFYKPGVLPSVILADIKHLLK
jgi:glutathione peroxidase